MNEKLNNIHPGEILLKEFLSPLNLSPKELAKKTNINYNTIMNILNGKQNISYNIALKLSKFFNTSIQFWIGLQNDFNNEKNI